MEFTQNSQVDMNESYLGSSVFSESSQLLNSRLSNIEMEKMEKESLLCKLLELCQALQNTQRDNQLLRIEKAQLRTQLKNCKTSAEQFIQANLKKSNLESLVKSNPQQRRTTLQNNLYQSIPNSFFTPCDSDQEKEIGQKGNKVFVKNHRRGVSNISDNQKHQLSLRKNKAYATAINTPARQSPIKFQKNEESERKPTFKKLEFPKNKLKVLAMMERQQDEKEQPETQTLQNFQSFYYPKKQDFGQTQRIGANTNNLQKRKDTIVINQWKAKMTRESQILALQQSDRNTEKCHNRSMSSSNLSNQRYFDQKGFNIPNSIDQIWGSSTAGNSKNILDRVNSTNNKLSKLSKVNLAKAGLQRKSYLNS